MCTISVSLSVFCLYDSLSFPSSFFFCFSYNIIGSPYSYLFSFRRFLFISLIISPYSVFLSRSVFVFFVFFFSLPHSRSSCILFAYLSLNIILPVFFFTCSLKFPNIFVLFCVKLEVFFIQEVMRCLWKDFSFYPCKLGPLDAGK